MDQNSVELLQKIFEIIDSDLSSKGFDYLRFEYSCLRWDGLGMKECSLTFHDDEGLHEDCSIEDHKIHFLFDDLHREMKDRGEDWKSCFIIFEQGKVKTRFGYEENPPPW
ncbi:hypothetical protein F9L16_21150 [Agarivorans sp. B2Z047]|uniref:hypothetical protein n=1 Tax=Agarivorans sp. B2Z047 TaxID=2652721 RepID=UPI00128B2A55|nr:hypothetical protein [Agarivorans sp. B2Z047]MPW31485.1 hypothetical protein [Agarivorans sp. B2Z047]UQN42528.1 hypothetical protein LQZ07_22580 [Agarivorans sp. B2Z047]